MRRFSLRVFANRVVCKGLMRRNTSVDFLVRCRSAKPKRLIRANIGTEDTH